MDSFPYSMCTFCPKLCRSVCPVAVATALRQFTSGALTVNTAQARAGTSEKISARSLRPGFLIAASTAEN